MHIGLLIYGSLNTTSGGYLYDRKLVEHLSASGDKVTIISLPWSNYGRHLTHNLLPHLYHQLRQVPLDILLQDELNHPSLFWLNHRLYRSLTYPIVTIVHHLRTQEQHPDWQLRLYRYIERYYLRTVDAFITNSYTTHQTITQLLGQHNGGTVTINGKPSLIAHPAGNRFDFNITPETIHYRAYETGPLRLLFVGNLIPRKGLHHLLTAVAQLPPQTIHLNIVGNTAVSPRYTYAIQQQIRQSQLETAVTFHNQLHDEQLAQLMARSQLLVVPSHYEGFGIVYLEGMAAGLPAIATMAGAAHETIQHNHNGYLIDIGDMAALSHHLHHLHHNRPLLTKLSYNALSHFQNQPTWTESMSQVRRFLTELVGSKQ